MILGSTETRDRKHKSWKMDRGHNLDYVKTAESPVFKIKIS